MLLSSQQRNKKMSNQKQGDSNMINWLKKIGMSRKILLMVGAILLTGCSSSVVETHYYQLATNIYSINKEGNQERIIDKSIWISQVNVADFLNQQGIVYQTSRVEYSVANSNLWLTALSDQIRSTLMHDLSIMLPDYLVTNEVKSNSTKKVALKIDSFHGTYAGNAVVAGQWIVTERDGDTRVKNFSCSKPLTKNGYPALVETLSSCFAEEEQGLAKYL